MAILDAGIEDAEAQIAELDRQREAAVTRLAELTDLRQGRERSADSGGEPSPIAKARLFADLFRGREDVFAVRWENATKCRSGYSPRCANEWRPGICAKPTGGNACVSLAGEIPLSSGRRQGVHPPVHGERYRRETPERINADSGQRRQRRLDPQAYREHVAAAMMHDADRSLRTIKAPTLVVHGASDRLIPKENGELIAREIPEARLHLIPHAGHYLLNRRRRVRVASRSPNAAVGSRLAKRFAKDAGTSPGIA